MYEIIKRVIDIVGSITALIILSPLFLILAILVKCTSNGPIIHKRRVLAKEKGEFDAYKFRSMVQNADEIIKKDKKLKKQFEKRFKLKKDPRLTPIGGFIRRTALDELPQLVNVLKGDMSLVGPRMIVKDELKYYGKYVKEYRSIKPGMTGYWQINQGNHNYEDRVKKEMYYIKNMSFWFDVKILFQTLIFVCAGRDRYK